MCTEIAAPSQAEEDSGACTASARQGSYSRQEETSPPAQIQSEGDKRAPAVAVYCTEHDNHVIKDIETGASTKPEGDREACTASARQGSCARQEEISPPAQIQSEGDKRAPTVFVHCTEQDNHTIMDIDTLASTKTGGDIESCTLGSARQGSCVRQAKPRPQLQAERGKRPSITITRQSAFLWRKRVDAAANGIAMARYGVVAAWIFVLQTGVSLGLSVAAASGMGAGRTATLLNLVFNVVFTLMYAGFLIAYRMMRRKPAPFYHMGVALYAVGYAVFVAFFTVGYAELKVDTTAVERGLYIGGSGLFLVGSALLVHATAPNGRGCDRRWCGGEPVHSLFWGSAMFLVGSSCFLLDSIREGNDTERISLAIAGFSAFFIGRLFFLHGSSTPQCDLLLRDRLNTK